MTLQGLFSGYSVLIHCAQVSISSTFYVCIFRTNVVLADFSSYVKIEKAAEMTFVQKICT